MKLNRGYIFPLITILIFFTAFSLIMYTYSSLTYTNNKKSHQDVKSLTKDKLTSTTIETFLSDLLVISETPIPTPTKRPTPTRTPTPTPIISADIEALFIKYSSSQSVDKDLLKRIAYCESKLNPSASNGIYAGLFQFSESAWISTRRRMNLDQNPQLRYNPEESIKTAAFKIATEGIGAWPNCSK